MTNKAITLSPRPFTLQTTETNPKSFLSYFITQMILDQKALRIQYESAISIQVYQFVDDPDMGEDHNWLFDDYDNYGFNDEGAGI